MKKRPRKRSTVTAGRVRVILHALKTPITHAQACRIGGFAQSWYHLEALRKAGLLERTEYNTWVATDLAARIHGA
jgi:hypothetical protein